MQILDAFFKNNTMSKAIIDDNQLHMYVFY